MSITATIPADKHPSNKVESKQNTAQLVAKHNIATNEVAHAKNSKKEETKKSTTAEAPTQGLKKVVEQKGNRRSSAEKDVGTCTSEKCVKVASGWLIYFTNF